jgi:hypothetical protein
MGFHLFRSLKSYYLAILVKKPRELSKIGSKLPRLLKKT